MNSNIPVYNGDLFTYDPASNVLSVEASNLSSVGVRFDAKIFKDSSDTGFYIKSPKTGVKQLFVFDKFDYDSEGVEIIGSQFKSYTGDKLQVLVIDD